MDRPRLYGTPLSHFTRKVRVVLAELGVDYEFVRTASVLDPSAAAYGDNPLLRVPTLVRGADTVIDSDHIARYLVAAYDPADRLGVNRVDVHRLNRLAVVSGIMNNEVVLILARRGGMADIEGVAYFRKLTAAIENGLAWLERAVDVDEGAFTYGDVATACMWQHLTHYGMVASPERFPRIAARVERAMARPSVASTTPERSLAEAKAAGWQPG